MINQLKPRLARRLLAGVVGLMLLVAGCGDGDPDAGASALPADASIKELAATFASCPEPLDAIAAAAEFIEEADRWMKVVRVEARDVDLDRTSRATVLVEATDGRSLSEESLSLHGSYWPGIDWALSHGGEVWAALAKPGLLASDDTVLYVIAYTPDGEAFFPGRCQHAILYEPLAQALGEDFNPRMSQLPGRTGDDLVVALRGQLPVDEPLDVIVLNPETVDVEYLESLQFAVVHIKLNAELGSDHTICTRVEAGWNDCFVPDAEAVKNGYAVNAFLDGTGVLEFWLLDADANLAKPIELLGKISVPSAFAGTDEIALRTELDTAQLGKGLESTAVLLESLPLADVDIDDPNWAGLRADPAPTDPPGDP